MERSAASIWLVTSGEPLPKIDGSARPMRTALLASAFRQAGCDVTWWTARFNHATKRQREGPTQRSIDPGVQVEMLDSPGYRDNKSLRRVLDHILLATALKQRAARANRPKLILVSYPPIELAAAAVWYGKQHNVPVVVDIRDLWPDIFLSGVTGVRTPLGMVGTSLYNPLARWTLRNATALTSITANMLGWALQKIPRDKTLGDSVFPFAYSGASPTPAEVGVATIFWNSRGINGQVPTYCYTGSVGDQLDVDILLHAHQSLQAIRPNSKLVICGTGSQLSSLQEAASNRRNLHCVGWVDRPKIWTLMRMSNAGLIPYRRRFDFEASVPNKVIEYMSAGLPILSTIQGATEALLNEHLCGITVPYSDHETLCKHMDTLAERKSRFQQLSAAGRAAFAKHFNAEHVYPSMATHLLSVRHFN